MEMFNYVMVLASIIIGLAITHLLKGIASIVVHPKRKNPYWIHLVWVAWLFLLAVSWWWFQFRLSGTETWTLGFYLFILFYAALLYLASALLFPGDLGGYEGYKDYFHDRKRWIYGIIIAIGLTDLADTSLKGWAHFARQGVLYPATIALFFILSIVALFTRHERFHAVFAVLMLGGQLALAASNYNVVQ